MANPGVAQDPNELEALVAPMLVRTLTVSRLCDLVARQGLDSRGVNGSEDTRAKGS